MKREMYCRWRIGRAISYSKISNNCIWRKKLQNHYNLKAIITVGNKVGSPRAVQFRKWANDVIEEFTIKGFTMDDERLKNFGTVLTKDYFEEQLQRVREIRLSERRFYQKITDIYVTSIDYDARSNITRQFFDSKL